MSSTVTQIHNSLPAGALYSEPLIFEDCVEVLVAPFALEPDILDEVPFPAHPQSLQQRDRGIVLAVGASDDSM